MSDLSAAELDRIIADPTRRVHFVGLGGAGMSALAAYRALAGGKASGSDRDFDRGLIAEERRRCGELGIEVFPQDGSGAAGADLVVASTAIEAQVPDLERARAVGVPVVHRAVYLASHVRSWRTIAVSGTSGKSTVTAMIFEALRGAGLDPGVITGGEIRSLERRGLRGNAWPGGGDLLVIEADESDKSLVHYDPECGVLLNLQRDHDEPERIAPVLATFKERTRGPFVVSDDPALEALRDGSLIFGFSDIASFRAEKIELEPRSSAFTARGVRVTLPVAGDYNVFNALAALAACHVMGVDLEGAARGLATFSGVVRRFETIGTAGGIEVIDDFAHNPAKVAAAIRAARRRGRRVLAAFHPHGFAPMRLLRADLCRAFAEALGPDDRLWFSDIYYAGGTAKKDISGADLAADVRALGAHAEHVGALDDLARVMTSEAREGDVLLSMGARNPNLVGFAQDLLVHLGRA